MTDISEIRRNLDYWRRKRTSYKSVYLAIVAGVPYSDSSDPYLRVPDDGFERVIYRYPGGQNLQKGNIEELEEVKTLITECDSIVQSLEDELMSLTGPEQTASEEITKAGKSDYRSKQWKKAKPIMKALYDDDASITLPKIKSDLAFQACFANGIPGDAQIRRKLKEFGIGLASGRRKKDRL
jgi:hypothetical protein